MDVVILEGGRVEDRPIEGKSKAGERGRRGNDLVAHRGIGAAVELREGVVLLTTEIFVDAAAIGVATTDSH